MARYMPAKVLDLNQPYATRTAVDKMSDIMPGIKPSAAFFTALRSNLILPHPNSSNASMPVSFEYDLVADLDNQPLSPHFFTSPSLPSARTTSQPALESIPPLATTVTTSTSARDDALKLIADSVAQQRQIASYALLTHPLTLASYVLLMATVARYLYHTPSNIGALVTTAAAITMACLIAVRASCSGYITAAEKIDLSYLEPKADRGEDILITSTFGSKIIGALVLHLEASGSRVSPLSSPKKTKRSHHSSNRQNHKGGKALIRAWTTAIQYRRKEIGRALLEEAVKVTRERLGKETEIGFAVEHANSLRILPNIFNKKIVRGEQQAARMLEEIMARMVQSSGKKRR